MSNVTDVIPNMMSSHQIKLYRSWIVNCQGENRSKLKNSLHWNEIFVVLVVIFMWHLRVSLAVPAKNTEKWKYWAPCFETTDIVSSVRQLPHPKFDVWLTGDVAWCPAWNATQSAIRGMPCELSEATSYISSASFSRVKPPLRLILSPPRRLSSSKEANCLSLLRNSASVATIFANVVLSLLRSSHLTVPLWRAGTIHKSPPPLPSFLLLFQGVCASSLYS